MKEHENIISVYNKDMYRLYGINHFIQKYGIPFNTKSKINMMYGKSPSDIKKVDIQITENEIQNDIIGYLKTRTEEVPLFEKPKRFDENGENLVMFVDNKGNEYPCIISRDNMIKIGFDIFNEVGHILTGHLECFQTSNNFESKQLMKIPVVDCYEKILFDCIKFASGKLDIQLKCKPFWPDGKKFAVCLTHDVDEIRKTYQYLTQAVRGLKDRKLSKTMYQLRSFFTDKIFRRNPYWTFEELMRLEEKLGVRSTFYFLKETAKVDIFKPSTWHHYARRYDFKEPDVASIIRKLSSSGWEIGLHGSYESYQDKEKLKYEKKELEDVLENKVSGIRQHHLNLKIPETWEYQEEAGFEYDTSLGFKGGKGIGFRWGTCFPFHPFNNGRMMSILEIPVTVMDISVTPDRNGWRRCLEVINTVEEYGGVLTLLWHHTVFNEKEYPGMRELYEKIISTCREKNGWITNASSIAKWWLKRELDGGGVEFVKSRT